MREMRTRGHSFPGAGQHTRRGTGRGARRGSALVEFALFFMLYLTLLLGLLELGRLVWTVATLSHAAREGARYATVHGSGNPDTDDQGQTITAESITSVVKGRAIGLDKQLIEVESLWDPDDSRGSLVRVQVEYSFQPLFSPILPSAAGLTLRTECLKVIAN